MNATAETLTQRFEPNVQMAKGQVIGIAALAAVVLAALDYFKLQLEHSVVRAACVAGVGFVALSVLFWFKTGRYGCQTVVLDESGLTLETNQNRSVLPWAELSEITLVGDSVQNSRAAMLGNRPSCTTRVSRSINGLPSNERFSPADSLSRRDIRPYERAQSRSVG